MEIINQSLPLSEFLSSAAESLGLKPANKHQRSAQDIKQAEVRVRFRNTTSPAAPPRSDCIRVPRSEGEFTLKDIGQGSVLVRYTIHLDPGGWLPGWVVRLFVQDAPVKTLRAFNTSFGPNNITLRWAV